MTNGEAFPLGATVLENGVNFSIYSPYADIVELLIFENDYDTNPKIYTLNPELNKTYYYWHIFVPELKEGTLYGYRIDGETSKRIFFDPSKVLLDPYGKAIVGNYSRKDSKTIGKSNLDKCLKNVVVGPSKFNWEDIQSPKFSHSQNIIYEMHLKGFTKETESPNAGTYSGLIEKIPYLKSLGVNTIELLPIYAFDAQDAPENHTNYWGYSPLSFFAPHAAYAKNSDPIAAIDELKSLIKALHQNNMKIVLDVVYNHTAESNETGPIYGFKGIANTTYYSIDEEGKYRDFTGCGNTINTNHSVVRRLIVDSLSYWKNEFHIDGFRFDLAGVLTRDENGIAGEFPPIIWEIDSNPALAETLLIAEPWDTAGLQSFDFPGDKWSIWQDFFRDTVRRTVRGDENMIKDFVSAFTGNHNTNYKDYLHYRPQRNINFVTCHDGFTLNDLVSFNHKHNWANGENNQDGSSHNLSYNYGHEGPTNDIGIQEIRNRQIKNFLCILLLSHGTPMLNMGDELKRSQMGNNNPYSIDAKINWVDWDLLTENQELFHFVQKLIEIRLNYQVFTFPDFFDYDDLQKNSAYFNLHGVKLNQPDFGHDSRSIALQFFYPEKKEELYLIFNFYFEELTFELPKGNWKVLIDTYDFPEKEVQNSLTLPQRSIVLLEKSS